MQNNKLQSKQLKEENIIVDLSYQLKNITNREKQYTIPIFIPHKGCKNECIFCNQRKISGTLKSPSLEDVKNLIQSRLESFKKNKEIKKIQIAFFGGSFTGLDIKEQESYLKIAYDFILNGQVDSIRISTRPDYINVKILKRLKKYGVESIELGVQSMDEEVLNKAKRGHNSRDVIRASRLINLFGFSLGHQIMIGLPGSTKEKEIHTINKLLKLNPKDLRIYPVYVISPSELYDMYKRKEYLPITMEEAIQRVYMIIKQCQKTDVRIIRIGLQSTDEITISNKKIYGPVSDNFAEYAIARIIRDELEDKINEKKQSVNNVEKVKLMVSFKFLSMAIGPKRVNKDYLNDKYKIKIDIVGY